MSLKKKKRTIGLAPGTLTYIGEKQAAKAEIQVINYSPEHYEENKVETIAACRAYLNSQSVTWININGVNDLDTIKNLGDHFKIHPLVLEDAVNTTHRPKSDVYDDYIYFLLKMLYHDPAQNVIQHEQVSLILGADYVISLQEEEGDVFDPVRARIKSGSGRIRKRGSDYLVYALIDTIVDHYFKILEELVEKIEDLQDQVITDPGKDTLDVIQQLKHEMLFVRRSVWPLRDIITSLIRDESQLIDENITLYLRDVHDHTLQVIDTVESIRDMLSGLLDVYLSSVSNRMNEVMKVLTIIATIFIPLTFIAGIYGMNFNYMPELNWRWSYPALWLVMLTILAIMIVWLKRRKWF